MADITTQKSTGLGALLEMDDICHKNILSITPLYTDFDRAVNTIGDLIELKLPADMDTGETTSTAIMQVLEQYDRLKTCPQYGGLFTVLNRVASELGEHIVSVFQLLQTSVYPEVESLREKITATTEELSRQEGTNIALLHDPMVDKEFDTLSFVSVLDNLGGVEEITRGYKDLTGYEPTANIADIAIALNVLRLHIQPLSLHEEAKADMLQRVKSRIEGVTDDALLEKILAILTTPYDFQSFIAEHLTALTSGNDLSAMLKHNISCLSTVSSLIALFRSTPFNLPDEILDALSNNIQQMEKALNLVAYSIFVVSQMFQSVLIIDEQTLNKEVLDMFYEQGGTKQDIVQFLFVYYLSKNIPVPNAGITMEDVQVSKEQVAKEFAAMNTSYQMDARLLLRNTMAKAMRAVLMDYLKDVEPSRLPEGMSAEMFAKQNEYLVNRCINMLDTQDEGHLENCLFTFIIDLWYDNTIVGTAHKLFGTETLKQLQIHTDLSEEQLKMIDARVAASLAANFLTTTLCTKKA